ncbi:MAG: hypothetical protein KA717_06040 [Woronichinia naegeliana WA131]|uniref:Uncharacterized protein n=1 Tax=Woronichinia naegeliana WA131 TaxID=2824559 RepID=A0A977L1L4_9CYAN|nr:MAG: hypothetical protein KA717_06040 [Woronichinia naegeliana WA131]
MITLTLLLPGKTVPVQSWTFETESVVRVGRAADSDVVLYSHWCQLKPKCLLTKD